MIEKAIDYLQISTLIPEWKLEKNQSVKSIRPISFYSRGYMDEFGVRMYFGNPNSKKASVVFSGTALNNLRLAKYDIDGQLRSYIDAGANISRVDWCITQTNDGDDKFHITVPYVADLFAIGQITGTLANYGAKSITGFDLKRPDDSKIGVETFYVGSMKRRGTNGIFRAYDKGIELDSGFARDMITRLELEERQSNAMNSVKRYLAGNDAGSIINTRLTCDDEKWKYVIDASPIDTTRGKQWIEPDNAEDKHEKRKRWLLKQVAKSIAETVVREPQFADTLNAEIWKHINDLT